MLNKIDFKMNIFPTESNKRLHSLMERVQTSQTLPVSSEVAKEAAFCCSYTA